MIPIQLNENHATSSQHGSNFFTWASIVSQPSPQVDLGFLSSIRLGNTQWKPRLPRNFIGKETPSRRKKLTESVESPADSEQVALPISQSSVTVLTLPPEDLQTTQKNEVVIGIPVHNAESWIARAIVEASNFGEVVICDDGSTDLTEEIARRMKCKMIKHPNELGMSDSITSLFLGARRIGADVLLTLGPGAEFSRIRYFSPSRRRTELEIATLQLGRNSWNNLIGCKSSTRDSASLTRAYGRKAVAMIAPARELKVWFWKEIFLLSRNRRG